MHLSNIVTTHVRVHVRAEGYVIRPGVCIYVYLVDMFVDKKNLNCTLVIDSPFQTFTVGLLVESID